MNVGPGAMVTLAAPPQPASEDVRLASATAKRSILAVFDSAPVMFSSPFARASYNAISAPVNGSDRARFHGAPALLPRR